MWVKAEEEKNYQSYYDAEGEEFRVYSDEEELRHLQEGMDGTSYQVSLERFRNDSSEYQYGDIPWRSSFDEVKEKLENRVSEYEVEGDYETWFQRQIDSLTDLYGEESVKEETENEDLGFETVLYKWDYENTSLQAVLTTGEDVKPAAAIGVILLEE